MTIRTTDQTTLEAFRQLFEDHMLTKRVAIPGVIRAVSESGGALQSVDVQPAIDMLKANEDGVSSSRVPMPVIPGVPLVFPYSTGSGLGVSIPVSVGDECMLLISDRSIDNWQFNGGVQAPVETTTPRTHNITDAVCIPGALAAPNAVINFNSNAVEVRNKDGSVSVSVTPEKVTLTGGSSTIEVKEGVVTVTADEFVVNAPAITLGQTGSITTVQYLAVVQGGTDSNGVSIDSHVHTSNGAGNQTSTPQS